jgi:DNA-binding MarR family transcriptional regulator
VTNIYDEALRPLGLKTSQLNLLVAAAKMGSVRPAEVCQCLQLDASTLSRNVERVKAKAWLEVVADADGRDQPFRLTPKKRKMLERAKPAWDKAQKKVRELVGDDVADSIDIAAKRVLSAK